jgi:hypothetical protein
MTKMNAVKFYAILVLAALNFSACYTWMAGLMLNGFSVQVFVLLFISVISGSLILTHNGTSNYKALAIAGSIEEVIIRGIPVLLIASPIVALTATVALVLLESVEYTTNNIKLMLQLPDNKKEFITVALIGRLVFANGMHFSCLGLVLGFGLPGLVAGMVVHYTWNRNGKAIISFILAHTYPNNEELKSLFN